MASEQEEAPLDPCYGCPDSGIACGECDAEDEFFYSFIQWEKQEVARKLAEQEPRDES